MSKYLLADIGSTYTKVCVVSTGDMELIAKASAPTTIEKDVNIGFNAAVGKIKKYVAGIKDTFVCSSAAGGLKMAVIGLVPELTAEAAKMAALGAGGKVIKTYAYSLNNDDVKEMKALKPDILVLSGGIDGGNKEYIVRNAERIAKAILDIPVIVAGNKSAYDEIREIFKGRKGVYFTDNVMPEFKKLNLGPTRELVRKVFLKRITSAKGLDKLKSRARILMPTPNAVFKASSLLSAGLKKEKGLGELMTIDIGGATTDVYSSASGAPDAGCIMLKGLPEPYDKRTVEADIGMRHTLKYLVEQVNLEDIAKKLKIDVKSIQKWVKKAGTNSSYTSESSIEEMIESEIAEVGCETAVDRHCGKIEEAYSPEGKLYLQEGKDLAGVKYVVGTGGAIVYSKNPGYILKGAIRMKNSPYLKPVNPRLIIDFDYIMWAMGLLSEIEPVAAIKMMKKYINNNV